MSPESKGAASSNIQASDYIVICANGIRSPLAEAPSHTNQGQPG